MTRDDVRRVARERIRWMEANFADAHVEPEIQCYFRLMCLIANGLEAYYRAFGWVTLEENDCFDAKYQMWRQELTPFERDALNLLNVDIEKREAADAARRRQATASVQPGL